MSDKKNPQTETPNTDENDLTEDQLEKLTAPEVNVETDTPEQPEEQPEVKEEPVMYGFFALAGKSAGGGGRRGRHVNPINEPIGTAQELQKHYLASGSKGDINAFIRYLGNNVGLTDSAIVRTFKTLVPGHANMKQPRVYQVIDDSLNTLAGLKTRIRTHKRLAFNDVIDAPEFGKLPAQAYAEVEQEIEQMEKNSKQSG